ncbi:MAG: ADOP family duplicated permease [Gemmatimonadales bacterium]
MRIRPGVRRVFRLRLTEDEVARDVDDEVRFHLAMRARSLEASGALPDDAAAEARRRFGDVEDLRRYSISLEVAHMQRARTRERLGAVAQDIRFALRQFRKSPGFAVVAAVTLALGIGATTAIFTVVNGVLLQPLPFHRPAELVQLWGLDAKAKDLHFADPTFDYLAGANSTLRAVAEYDRIGMSVADHGNVTRIDASAVSRRFFDVLDVKPLVGRLFAPGEQQLNAPTAAVISYGFWMREFGGAPGAIGATLRSGDTPVTVVGVLPKGQEFPAGVDLWYPRETFAKNTSYTAHNWNVIARLKSGVTPAQAANDVALQLRRLHATIGDATWTFSGTAIPLREQIVGNFSVLLLLVLGASVVLLLIACANVANLLIARLAAREGEIAVRLAIGAARSRLAQQFLIEAGVLSIAGCAGGLLLAAAGMRILLALRPAMIPRVGELHLDGWVLLFAVLLTVAMTVGLGVVAAWRGAGADLHSALAQSQRSQGHGAASYRVRGSLVVAQLAMTVVLLIGAGLLARSFVRLMTINPGFRTHGVVVAGMAFDPGRDSTALSRRTQFYDQLAARAEAIRGVTGVGISDAEPFSGGSSNGIFLVLPGAGVKITMEGLLQSFQQSLHDRSRSGFATYRLASPGYFNALDIPLIKGRVFDEGDRAGSPEVAVVNAALARAQWPGQSAIGKVIEFGNIDGDLTPLTIVGVVGDTREENLARDPQPAVYVSYAQRPGNSDQMYLIMATNRETPTIAAARQAFTAMRSDVPMRFQTVETIVGSSVADQRFMLLVVGIFGAVALLLATLGIYSVISYLVAQRGREISVRVALGASASDVVLLVLRQGMMLAALGAAVGAAAALAATRTLKHLLYQVSPTDAAAFAGVLVLVTGVALVASWFPARRAARLEPMDVLRAG